MRNVLIANRGEIAVRVARTARTMGLRTIAVASASDAGAPHTRACDLVMDIGGQTPAESYLRIDKILDAAARGGADAVHPGYGFLSENAAFARAVAEAGLTWIGPPPEAIEAMGDKARARVRIAAAGLPVVPGYDGEAQDLKRMAAEADRIGYPVMIKAAAGGGGRGMRLVADPGAFAAALASAASEAEKAFGDGRLILEQAVREPRHVEVQVFADRFGEVVHLGERDCSVQRRHQKVIEEAPSPAVDAALREAMCACAVSIAREIGYAGAGTVEFLLDREGRFYFMEMNTRLQVEHPVTEAITGLDLVEWQLRIAAGEPLPLRQEDIRLDGWAMEARLCAEDPAEDYAPRTGVVAAWTPPPGARCDHALAEGVEVTPFFDSMLGKVIVHGRDRAQACERLQAALDDTTLLGVVSNRLLLRRIAADAVFRQGAEVSTGFLAQRFAEPAQRTAAPGDDAWALAAWLSATAEPSRWATPEGWRDWSSARAFLSPWRLRSHRPDAVERRGAVSPHPGGASITGGEAKWAVEGVPARPGGAFTVLRDGRLIEVVYAWAGHELWLKLRDRSGPGSEAVDHVFTDLRRAPAVVDKAADDGRTVLSPLSGRVIGVEVEEGAVVAKGDRLIVMEAMKMEHTLTATAAGRVVAVRVKTGDQVPPRTVLVELEPLEEEPK